jgi:hypothetical protein
MDGKWHPTNAGEILASAHLFDRQRYHAEFGDVPPLPNEAFGRPKQEEAARALKIPTLNEPDGT